MISETGSLWKDYTHHEQLRVKVTKTDDAIE